jgi:hypothetical protein
VQPADTGGRSSAPTGERSANEISRQTRGGHDVVVAAVGTIIWIIVIILAIVGIIALLGRRRRVR